jgi:hypothetical protein
MSKSFGVHLEQMRQAGRDWLTPGQNRQMTLNWRSGELLLLIDRIIMEASRDSPKRPSENIREELRFYH